MTTEPADDDEKQDRGPSLPGHPTQSRDRDERHAPGDVGEEPDPRFTFANERTFLAWNRTALALVSAGAAAAAFLDDLGGARLAVSIPLIVVGAGVSLSSYRRWVDIERAMRLGEPMPYSRLPQALGSAIAVLALIVAILAVVDVVK